jgi:hypothetical protein
MQQVEVVAEERYSREEVVQYITENYDKLKMIACAHFNHVPELAEDCVHQFYIKAVELMQLKKPFKLRWHFNLFCSKEAYVYAKKQRRKFVKRDDAKLVIFKAPDQEVLLINKEVAKKRAQINTKGLPPAAKRTMDEVLNGDSAIAKGSILAAYKAQKVTKHYNCYRRNYRWAMLALRKRYANWNVDDITYLDLDMEPHFEIQFKE